ncbi:hypothetical protein ACFQS6_14770 [Xanthomonas populi]
MRSIINLRAADEPITYDEASEAARLGLRYVSLPIAGPEAVNAEAAARLAHLLEPLKTPAICHH